MKLYFFTYLARPKMGSESFESYGGAYVNCWIDAPSEAEAAERASTAISRSGWDIESLEHSSLVTREAYADDDEGLRHFEQALIDKEFYVFHTWPPGPQENDSVD